MESFDELQISLPPHILLGQLGRTLVEVTMQTVDLGRFGVHESRNSASVLLLSLI